MARRFGGLSKSPRLKVESNGWVSQAPGLEPSTTLRKADKTVETTKDSKLTQCIAPGDKRDCALLNKQSMPFGRNFGDGMEKKMSGPGETSCLPHPQYRSGSHNGHCSSHTCFGGQDGPLLATSGNHPSCSLQSRRGAINASLALRISLERGIVTAGCDMLCGPQHIQDWLLMTSLHPGTPRYQRWLLSNIARPSLARLRPLRLDGESHGQNAMIQCQSKTCTSDLSQWQISLGM